MVDYVRDRNDRLPQVRDYGCRMKEGGRMTNPHGKLGLIGVSMAVIIMAGVAWGASQSADPSTSVERSGAKPSICPALERYVNTVLASMNLTDDDIRSAALTDALTEFREALSAYAKTPNAPAGIEADLYDPAYKMKLKAEMISSFRYDWRLALRYRDELEKERDRLQGFCSGK
ncbi:MAG: hypothetical protein V2B18_16645 [Pseudomonadota bacterium]